MKKVVNIKNMLYVYFNKSQKLHDDTVKLYARNFKKIKKRSFDRAW